MMRLGHRKGAGRPTPSSRPLLFPSKEEKNQRDDERDKAHQQNSSLKVALSLMGLLIALIIMFSVFTPKSVRPPDRPQLHVMMDRAKKIQDNIKSAINDINLRKTPPKHTPPMKQNQHTQIDSPPTKALPQKQNTTTLQPIHQKRPKPTVSKPQKRDSDSQDIEFIDAKDDDDRDAESDKATQTDSENLYATPSNPPRPPQSIHVTNLSTVAMKQIFEENVDEQDMFDSSNLPGADHNGRIYLMNYIFLPYEQMMSIFLLTPEYLDPKHGLHAWPTRKRAKELPDLYKNIRSTIYKNYKSAPPFACIFRLDDSNRTNGTDPNDKNENLWISKVDFVPNNTTRDRYVNNGTEIMRCHVPMTEMNKYYDANRSPFLEEDYKFQFIFTQKWRHLVPSTHADYVSEKEMKSQQQGDGNYNKLVHASLSFEIGKRSGIRMFGNDDSFIYSKANQNRFLTLCMPPISEVMAFLQETVAHYIANIGIEHIYIGTHFNPQTAEKDRSQLIQLLQPWYDRGLITIWPHEQPWIDFTDKAKSHWLNQCLFYVKSRDQYTLSLDADEFLLLPDVEEAYKAYNEEHNIKSDTVVEKEQFEERQKAMRSQISTLIKKSVKDSEHDRYCWLTFESYTVWQLLHPEEPYLVRRYSTREEKAQLTWSKIIWNNKHLHFTGYHAGGSCSAQQYDWRQAVNDWREERDEKHVYRFDPVKEGALLHYYNSRHVRMEPKDDKLRNPWFKPANDSRMRDVYWQNIRNEFEQYKLNATYPDKTDVMNTAYYQKHYGFGNSMLSWKESE